MDNPGIRKLPAIGTALIMIMFAIWGLSHALFDCMLPGFIRTLSLSEVQVTVTHWVRSFGYCLIAIPAAFFLRNLGYKAGVVGGLGCFAVALFMFYPAEAQHSYTFFVFAGLLANCGVALLEIAADPWIMRLGPARTAIHRLNIAQTLNPIGRFGGTMIGGLLLTAAPMASTPKFHPLQPYIVVGVGVLFFAYLIDKVRFSPVATERVARDDRTTDDLLRLAKRRGFQFGLAALALYIVGQSFLWGFVASYGQGAGLSAASVAEVASWTLYAFIIGRVVGTALMFRFDPARLLAVFAGAAAALSAAAAFMPGWNGIWCIVGASFFLSILFPTVFGLAAQEVGKSIQSASALLIMASGSANMILPTFILFSGEDVPPYIMLLPSLCFLVILGFAVTRRPLDETADADAPGHAAPVPPALTPAGR